MESAWKHYLRLARLLTGDRHRAEELLQDSLIGLYAHWRRVSARGDPHAYLRRMLINGTCGGQAGNHPRRPVDRVAPLG